MTGAGEHIRLLEQKNARLKHEIRVMQKSAEDHNRKAFATGLIVNCTGCLAGGPANYESMTEENVKIVEQIATRLRDWWQNNQHRITKE